MSSGINKRKYAAARKAVRSAAASLRRKGYTSATAMELTTPLSRTGGSGYGSGGFGGMSKKLPYYRQPELKCVDTPLGSYSLSTAAPINVLNVPIVGAAFYQRVGNEIEMKSLHMIGNIIQSNNTVANPGVSEYCRIMIIYDRSPNGSYPAIADILTSYNEAGSTTSTVYDFTNPNNFDRFKMLADIRLDFGSNDTSIVGSNAQINGLIYQENELNINRFINLKGLATRFKASAGSIGDISSGSLLLVTYGNKTSSTCAYLANLAFRLRYID